MRIQKESVRSLDKLDRKILRILQDDDSAHGVADADDAGKH